LSDSDTLLLKRALGRAWNLAPAKRERRIVLLYHAVGDGDWAIATSDFAMQMEWIATRSRPIALVQALNTEVEQPLEIAVTFDDGYGSISANAYPVLKSLGMTATVFLNTAYIGDREPTTSKPEQGHYPGECFLLWREVDQLLNAGWIMGSHGDLHLDLTRQTDEIVLRELLESKRKVERLTPGACGYFAYTWGRHTARLRSLVAEAGYRWGLTGKHGEVRSNVDCYAIPRINIDKSYTFEDFKAILRGDWDYLRFVQAWRAARS